MSKIVIFGAGGRAGRQVISEARRRGHQVTAVVRDPAKYAELAADGVDLVVGDITAADSVAAAVAGHDAVVNAAARVDVPADVFFVSSATALLSGLAAAGVPRLLFIGMAANLETAPGVRVMDAPDFPAEYLPFSLGHTAMLHVLRASNTTLDWLMVSPPMVLDEGPRTGRYRVGKDELLTTGDGQGHLSYADLAVALLDEIDTPRHHRTRISVGD